MAESSIPGRLLESAERLDLEDDADLLVTVLPQLVDQRAHIRHVVGK